MRRLAAVALTAVAFAAVGGGTAHAGEIGLDGCYGALVVVCEPTVHYETGTTLRWDTIDVPVCVGTCQEVGVPILRVEPWGEASVCVTYDSSTLPDRRCNQIDG